MKPAGSDFAVVIGESHVRAFARHRAFLPLFIGSGKETSFVTRAHAASTTERILRNLERLDPRLLIVTLGEPDVRLHLENKHGTRDAGPASDLPQVEAAVHRYQAALSEVRARWDAPIVALSSPPTPRPEHNRLARVFNDRMAVACAAIGVHFLDVWQEFMLPGAGVVDPRFSADHVHLNEQIVPIIVSRLQRLGLLAAEVQPQNDFDWTYLYRFAVGTAETRVWGDVNLGSAQHLLKFGRSDMVTRCVSRIGAILAGERIGTIMVADAKEGFAAFNLAKDPSREIVAWEPEHSRVEAGQRLCAFARREDISFCRADWRNAPDAGADVVVALGDNAFFSSHPLSEKWKAERVWAAVRIARVGAFILGDSVDLSLLKGAGFQKIERTTIAYRTSAGQDRETTLFWARKQRAKGLIARWLLGTGAGRQQAVRSTLDMCRFGMGKW